MGCPDGGGRGGHRNNGSPHPFKANMCTLSSHPRPQLTPHAQFERAEVPAAPILSKLTCARVHVTTNGRSMNWRGNNGADRTGP
eukprot:5248992-Pyramimonas_sp.AAC.1